MLLIMTSAVVVLMSVLGWLLITALARAAKRYQAQFSTYTQVQLSDAFIFMDAWQLSIITLCFCSSVFTLSMLLSHGWALSFCLAIVSMILPKFFIRHLKLRRLKRFDQQLPDFLAALAGALRSGAGIQNALSSLSIELMPPMSQELALLMRKQRLGLSFSDALDELADRMPTEACTLMTATLKAGSQSGGSIAGTVDEIALLVKDRIQLQERIAALTSQGKMQAWVMSLLPLVLFAVLSRLDPEGMHYLWHSLPGWCVLALIGILEFTGLMLLRRIVRIDI